MRRFDGNRRSVAGVGAATTGHGAVGPGEVSEEASRAEVTVGELARNIVDC